jgi:hypothetical protein
MINDFINKVERQSDLEQRISALESVTGIGAVTGAAFVLSVNSKTGAVVLNSEDVGAYPASNPNGFITGVDLSNYVQNSQTGNFLTIEQADLFYTVSNPSGFITGIENLVYTTGDQIVNGTKFFTSGIEVFGLESGISTLFISNSRIGINNETPSASLDVSGSTIFSERPFVNGTGILLSGEGYPNSNPSGFITGVDLSSYVQNSQTGSFVTTEQTGLFYAASNPSGFITGVDLSSYVQNSQTGSFVTTEQTGLFYAASNPSGFITGVDTSNFVTGSEFIVYTTGDQTISGIKTFTSDLYIRSGEAGTAVLHVESGKIGINNEFPSASLDVNGSVKFTEKPTINGVPLLLSGEAYPSSNPSGFITGVDLSSYVQNSQTGNFITTAQTGAFYAASNPSGFITGIQNLVYTTGDQNISGIKTFANSITVLGDFAVSGTTYINEVIDVTTTGVISGVSGVFQNLTANNILYSQTNSYIVAQPGDNLAAKYAEAKLLTPNGSAKSTTNRASLVIMPGSYALAAELAIDAEFVDVIALGAQVKKPAVFIINNTLNITANDVRISGISVGEQIFLIAENKALQIFENCAGAGSSFGGGGVTSGTFTSCVGGDYSFGGLSTASGTFNNCTGGAYSFGGSGAASGTFKGCTGGDVSLGGNGEASGTFKDCASGDVSFGSYGIASGTFTNCIGIGSFGAYGTASGTFTNCTDISSGFGGYGSASGVFVSCVGGDSSFGSYGEAGGAFTNCIGGVGSFGGADGSIASGTFANCIGGANSFGGGDSSTASGTFNNCIGGVGSFGFVISGKLFYCKLASGTYEAPSGAGLIRLSLDGNNDIVNAG